MRMQLAAAQRPHPPPVPPRPSQQVVREALKRSPRPPCPTRQAPPPPNTKPWRQEQVQEAKQAPVPGRTVVYESTKDTEVGSEGKTPEKLQRSSERSDQQSLGRHQRENRLRTGEQHDQEDREKAPGSANAKEKREEPSKITSEHGSARANKVETQKTDRDVPRKKESVSPGKTRGIYENLQSSQTRGDFLEDDADSVDKTDAKDDEAAAEEDSAEREIENDRSDEKDWKEEARDKSAISSAKCQLARPKPRVPSRSAGPSSEEGRSATSDARSIPESHREARVMSPPKASHVNTVNKEGKSNDKPVPVERSGLPKDAEIPNENSNRRSSTISVSSDDCATVVVIDESNVIFEGEDSDNIHRQDWLEAGVRYSSTQITLAGDDGETDNERVNGFDHSDEKKIGDLDYISIQERIAMSSLQGLPPLPRSLSGFNLSNAGAEPPAPPARSSSKSSAKTQPGKIPAQTSSSRPSPPARQLTTLDTQLAILRREMFGLRQLDLSLLSQLWSLNESIQEFRQLLQEQEDRAPSPSPSSEEGDDTSYGTHPPPPPRRPAPVLHHHRPPPPPRPPRPPPSDESPSSEEYGAV